jgi:hypothetical protein
MNPEEVQLSTRAEPNVSEASQKASYRNWSEPFKGIHKVQWRIPIPTELSVREMTDLFML